MITRFFTFFKNLYLVSRIMFFGLLLGQVVKNLWAIRAVTP